MTMGHEMTYRLGSKWKPGYGRRVRDVLVWTKRRSPSP